MSKSFKPASRKQGRLRLALAGAAGTGKTWTMLEVASRLCGPDRRIAVIDSEGNSVSKYHGMSSVTDDDITFDFDVVAPTSFAPRDYVSLIREAGECGEYDVLCCDSLSAPWSGPGGVLEIVDKHKQRGDKALQPWAKVAPDQQMLTQAILHCGCHLIATLRAKSAWEIETDDRGRKQPKKIGLKPDQKDTLDYEFDVVGLMLDTGSPHRMEIIKTHCPPLSGAVIADPGADFAATLQMWLADGEPPAELAPRDYVEEMAGPTDPDSPLPSQRERLAEIARRVYEPRASELTALKGGKGAAKAAVWELAQHLAETGCEDLTATLTKEVLARLRAGSWA
jgi:AAA domain